jgi:hypothetical protein
MPVRTKDTAEILRRNLGIDKSALIAEVEKKLKGPPKKGTEESQKFWALELSYLQSQGLALLTGMRALAHPALLIGVAAAAAVLLIVSVFQRASAGQSPLADPRSLDPQLAVGGLLGTPQRLSDGRGEPLKIGQRVAEGARLVTGPDEQIKLESQTGLVVKLFGASELKIVWSRAPGGSDTELVLEIARGVVVADARGALEDKTMRIRGGSAEVTGARMLVRVELADSTLAAYVGEGKVSLASRAGAGEIDLEQGQSSAITGTAAPTSVEPYGLQSVDW